MSLSCLINTIRENEIQYNKITYMHYFLSHLKKVLVIDRNVMRNFIN